jgi:hypothetical protein
MKSIIYFLCLGLGFLCGCTEGIPDAGSSGGAASFVPYTGTTTDPALLYNRRFALEDIKQFETLPERLPAEFFDINTRYWPAVTDKAYKQAIFEAIKEVIAFVDYLPQSGYDFKRTWGDFNNFSTRFDNWEDWLEDVYRDYDPTVGDDEFATGEKWPHSQEEIDQWWNIYSERVFYPFSYHHLPIMGISLQGYLPAAYRSLLFCEAIYIYYRGVSNMLYGQQESNFGSRTVPRYTDPIENHELYVSAMLCKFQRLYNAFKGQTDEQIKEVIDDNFDPLRSLWFSALEEQYTYIYTQYFSPNE